MVLTCLSWQLLAISFYLAGRRVKAALPLVFLKQRNKKIYYRTRGILVYKSSNNDVIIFASEKEFYKYYRVTESQKLA